MSLYLLFALSLVLFVALRFWALPRVRRSVVKNPAARVGHAGLLAGVGYAQTLCLLAAVAYAALIALVFLLGRTRGVTTAELGAVARRLQTFRDALDAATGFWTYLTFALIALAASIFIYRRWRGAQGEGRAVTLGEAGRERLRREYLSGRWRLLPPTPEMEELRRELHVANFRLEQLEAGGAGGAAAAAECEVLRGQIQRLFARRAEADLVRRAKAGDEGPDGPAAPGWKGKAQTFLVSVGLFDTLKVGSRALTLAGLLVLLVSLVGLNAPALDGGLARRQVYLRDLQAKASEDEAAASFEGLLAAAEDGGDPHFDEEDERVAGEIAREFERAVAEREDWRVREPPDDDDALSVRWHFVRDQIVSVSRRGDPDARRGGRGPDGDPPPSGGPTNRPKGPNGGSPPPPDTPGGDSRAPRGRGNGNGSNGTASPGRPAHPNPPPVADGPQPEVFDGSEHEIRRRAVRPEGPQTKLGERAAADARDRVARRSGKTWDRVKSKWQAFKAEFGRPVKPFNLGQYAFGEALGGAAVGAWDASGVEEVARSGAQEVFTGMAEAAYEQGGGRGGYRQAGRRLYRTLWRRFYTDLAGDVQPSEAVARVRSAELPVATAEEVAGLRRAAAELNARAHSVEGLREDFAARPASLPERAADAARTEAAARQLARRYEGDDRAKITAAEFVRADTYTDHYPGRADSLPRTAKGGLLKPAEVESRRLLAQARDFKQLKKAFDVGGVLVGRDPEPADGRADVRDFSWRDAGDGRLALTLRRADGREFSPGSFDRELVHQALSYAADGRKVVVTIQQADPARPERGYVLLHPALVDTPLGRDIVAFDNLVFDLMPDTDPLHGAAKQRAAAQLALYEFGNEYRRLLVNRRVYSGRLDKALMRGEAGSPEDTQGLAETERRMASLLARYRPHLLPVLSDPTAISDPLRSPPAKGGRLYDQALVGRLSRCAAGYETDWGLFCGCLEKNFQDDYNRADDKTVSSWFEDLPETHPRSIAEELPYSVSGDLGFLSPPRAGGEGGRLWPFEFRYEIAFPAVDFGEEAGGDAESLGAPFEYVELREHIAAKVAQGVEEKPELRSMFARVREFTVLQRLFRAALEGRLGARFPAESLVLLAAETAGDCPYAPTPREDTLR